MSNNIGSMNNSKILFKIKPIKLSNFFFEVLYDIIPSTIPIKGGMRIQMYTFKFRPTAPRTPKTMLKMPNNLPFSI